MCVPHPADHAAATRYKPNEVVMCSWGQRQGWDWLHRIQTQLGGPCPRQEDVPLSRPSPHLGGTMTQGDRLQGARLHHGTQSRRPELGASTQACNSKLNKLLGCFRLVKH